MRVRRERPGRRTAGRGEPHWAMVPAGGGAVLGGGTDILLLAPDGLIRSDCQFITT
ncbi:hypothetical protein [Kribbella sp.]|uniref:hypothetical protein n=1 Tax=Kribbella sp. TaxID=1871183 RepID=UPI002D2E3827|nr:hypothetical protein [Kribbella sp.]HZX07833.1 hypothetical protein [Kribbella sp.]